MARRGWMPTYGALLVATLLLAGACTPVRIGVVDSNRLLFESARALVYQRQLDDREKLMAIDLQALRGKLPAADLEARRTQYLKELQQIKEELEIRLNQEIREVVAEIAREKGLRHGVIVKNSTVFSLPGQAVDITDDVIARLR